MKRIIILTGAEPRHTFVRKAIALSPRIEVLCSYCEGLESSLGNTIVEEGECGALQRRHVAARAQSEEDFFAAFNELAPDRSGPIVIAKGEINRPGHVRDIEDLKPDLLAAYGCSLIKSSLVTTFAGRFLNVHLGLSPYYRGSGANFWPLVNGEPEYVGATFMHLDEGVDTGRIIHQLRARVFLGDTPHLIGNRLIADAGRVYRRLIERFDELDEMAAPRVPARTRYYRRRDFAAAATQKLYDNFAAGMIDAYLRDYDRRAAQVPIVENPALSGENAA